MNPSNVYEMGPPALPETYLVGRGRLCEWLQEWGFTEQSVRKLIETGVIKGESVANSRTLKYCPLEVVQDLGLNRWKGPGERDTKSTQSANEMDTAAC